MNRKALTVVLLCVLTRIPALAMNQDRSALSGLYTINHAIPTDWPIGTNFNSFADAVNTVMIEGVADAVVFDVYDDGGPYNETIGAGGTLGLIPGVSEVNTVTFREAAGEDVELSSNSSYGIHVTDPDSGEDPQYLTFEGFRIDSTNYSPVFVLDGDFITLRNCEISCSNNNYPGIQFLGSGGDYCQSPLIVNTMITGNSSAAISLTNTPGADVIFNSIYQTRGTGIFMDSQTAYDVPARVANNAVYCSNNTYGLPVVISSTSELPLVMDHNDWYAENTS
ncbi:MAG TPA: right-handed parallel beta-helix repeat-containing protein, partial [bacterium]|nr:right-handed parallel beta-helix repeat-containing protein [bacterium]